jgi:hypothetical protein
MGSKDFDAAFGETCGDRCSASIRILTLIAALQWGAATRLAGSNEQ